MRALQVLRSEAARLFGHMTAERLVRWCIRMITLAYWRTDRERYKLLLLKAKEAVLIVRYVQVFQTLDLSEEI